MRERLNRRAITFLAAGHATIDLCQGVVPALVPFLVRSGEYTYEAASKLVFAISITSSVVQPLFGQWADKATVRWLLPGSILLTGFALALGAQSAQYSLIFAAFLFCGIGVAAFHPEAARQANLVSGEQKGVGMGIFTLGGAIGFALAPGTTALLENHFGREGLLLLLFLTLAMALAVYQMVPSGVVPSTTSKVDQIPFADDWRGFGVLTLITISRSIIFFSLNTFMASYFIQKWKLEPGQGALAVTILLITSIPATLIGGWLADRFGRRGIARTGFTLALLQFFFFPWIEDRWLAMCMLIPFGLCFFCPSGVLVVLGQEYLPNRVGMASGVTLGLAVSVGGMTAPFIGRIADLQGVPAVLRIIQIVLTLAVLAAWLLPKRK